MNFDNQTRSGSKGGPLEKLTKALPKGSLVLIMIYLWLTATGSKVLGDEALSGKISAEGGSFQTPGNTLKDYQYSSLSLESHQDLLTGLSWGLDGEGDWEASGGPMVPTWPVYSTNNVLKLETNNLTSSNEEEAYSLRLNRAYLHWATGRLEMTAGLFKPDWGTSYFFRPTDYFNPLSPLQWRSAEGLGSEGAEATCFLLDDLSIQGAARWLENNRSQGVIMLVDKGIGIKVAPSIAWMTGRNGFGLEMIGTFPTLQIRVEGVDWLYPDGQTASNWNLGVSTTHEGVKYTAEFLRDETGEILGVYSNGIQQVTYAYLLMEGKFFEQWRASPAMVLPLEGGPFFLWPRVSWEFQPGWEMEFQAQWLIGDWEGPLELYPSRSGVSLSYGF